jgi:hypothetical protein
MKLIKILIGLLAVTVGIASAQEDTYDLSFDYNECAQSFMNRGSAYYRENIENAIELVLKDLAELAPEEKVEDVFLRWKPNPACEGERKESLVYYIKLE